MFKVNRGKDKNDTLMIDVHWSVIGKVIAVIVGFWVLQRVQTLIMYLLFSILFAIAIYPLISWFQKHGFKRGSSLAISLMIIVGSFIGIIGFMVASLSTSVVDFADNIPAYLDDLSQYETIEPVVDSVRVYVEDLELSSVVESGLSRTTSLLSGISKMAEATLFIFFFTVYILLEKDYLVKVLRSLIPKKWASRTDDVLSETVEAVGGYIRGQSIASISIGIVSYIIFRILGIPNALALAIIVGLTDIIPVVGGLLGLIPVVLISLTVSPWIALLVVIIIQIYSTVNNNVIKPRIYGKSLDLSPFMILLSTTAGLMIFGAPGIILALPFAAVMGFVLTKYKGIPILDDIEPNNIDVKE